jgi:hypothetical protein
MWGDFPVRQSPRPVVFLDQRVRFGDLGFVDSDAKLAYLTGAVEAAVVLPDRVLEVLTDTRWEGPRPGVRALRVESVQSVEAPFRTDRGPRRLPALELQITGLKQPCAVLSPQQPIWWPRTAKDWVRAAPGGEVKLEPDGRTLQVQVLGGCLTEFLGVEFVESDTAVIAKPLTSERLVDPLPAIPAVGISRTVIGTLMRPLGGRVLIDREATPQCVVESH